MLPKNSTTILISVLGWSATVVAFYLALSTSSLSETAQVAIIEGWISLGIFVWAYFVGMERGSRRSGRAPENLGIVRSFRRLTADEDAPLSGSIQNSSLDILFVGLSLIKLDGYAGDLEKKAQEGTAVRLLVPDPCEKWLAQAIARFLRREEPYPREVSWFFSNFLPLWKKYPSKLQVRVHSLIPTMSASMFDGKIGSVELYMYGWKTNDRVILEVDFDGSAKDWKNNLELMWKEATRLSSEEMFQERIRAADRLSKTTTHRKNQSGKS